MVSIKKISLYIVYYVCLLAIIYCLFVGYGFWSGLFLYVANIMRNHDFKYGFLLFPLFEIVVVVIPVTVLACVYNRKYLNRSVQKRENHTALLIPCHKSESIIGKTLENALLIFDKESIFVIDNAHNENPLDNTKTICERYGVNYTWVPIGSKIVSMYVGAKLAQKFEYILQIDDDMVLDKDMTFPIKEDTDCIAYVMSAINKEDKETTLVQKCQDVEYKTAGIVKAVHSWLGNVSFAHGGISLWKRTSFIKVLENHPMYPISDDWFTGYIANTMGMRIRVCDQKFISSDTPRTLFGNGRVSGYGSATVWKQRFFRWYALILLQIVYNIYYLFFVWSFSFRRILFQKLFMLWRCGIMTIIILRYVILGYSFYLRYTFTLIMFFASLITWLITFLVFNVRILKGDEKFDWYMFFLFPFYKFQDIFLCIGAMYYGLLYKIPNVLIEDRINIKNNEKINKVLGNYTLTEIISDNNRFISSDNNRSDFLIVNDDTTHKSSFTSVENLINN